MTLTSYNYIITLLKDPNLCSVELQLDPEDNEFNCRITCRTLEDTDEEEGEYGYEANNLNLLRIERQYPMLIPRLKAVQRELDKVAEIAARLRIYEDLKKDTEAHNLSEVAVKGRRELTRSWLRREAKKNTNNYLSMIND